MHGLSRSDFLATAVLVGGILCGTTATAQTGANFPLNDQPIRFIVPFPPGGTSDLRARQVADRMRQQVGWNILVENRPGASAMIGTEVVARAAPDGHTWLLGTIGSVAINPHIFPQQSYDVLRDLQPVTQFSRSVTVLMAHKSLGVRNLGELATRVRSGTKLAYASTGNGTIGHMVGEIYKRRTRLDITHVPYKGTAPAVQDFIAAHVPLLYETPSAAWEHIRNGTAVPLAVTSGTRMPQMPDVPTFRESGYPDMVFDTWQGVLTTRGVSPAVLDTISRQMTRALLSPDIVRSHEEQVNVVVGNSPAEFERFIATETVRWGKVVKETGVRPD